MGSGGSKQKAAPAATKVVDTKAATTVTATDKNNSTGGEKSNTGQEVKQNTQTVSSLAPQNTTNDAPPQSPSTTETDSSNKQSIAPLNPSNEAPPPSPGTNMKDSSNQQSTAPQSTSKEPPKSVDGTSNSQSTTNSQTTAAVVSQPPVSEAIKKEDIKSKTKGDNPDNQSKQENTAPAEKMTEGKKDESVAKGEVKATAGTTNQNSEETGLIPSEPEDQRKFDDAISSACLLVKSDSMMKYVTKNVTKLQLLRALPTTFSLYGMISKMSNLQEIDISNNNIGPQGFRSICLAMCSNTTILSLNLADNKADTDSAECIGKLLTENKTLMYLDVSNNYLGLDYFSRCVGPALKVNDSLRVLRAENLGSTDVKILLEGLLVNKSLTELDLSKNYISNRESLGKGFGEILKRPDCCLTTLALGSCELSPAGLEALREGLVVNSSLRELNLNGNEFGSLTNLLKMVTTAVSRPGLQTLSISGAKVSDNKVSENEISASTEDGSLGVEILSLNNSHLTDEFWSELAKVFKGRQLRLADIDIGANGDLTANCIQDIVKLTSGEDTPSTVRKMTISGYTRSESLPEQLTEEAFPGLLYLNVRKSRIPDAYSFSRLFTSQNLRLSTLILDGLKIANTDTLEKLLENAVGGTLTSLSLGTCSLSATDIAPLCQILKKGLQLQMLKLSANRLEDQGIIDLTSALTSNKTHPLAVLDVSSNMVGDEGSKSLASLFTHKKHKSQLHSLNVSSNCIGKEGIACLVSVIGGKSSLRTLYAQSQEQGLNEGDIADIYTKLASSVGFKVKKEGEVIIPGCCDLPNLPDGFRVNMTGLGGYTGEIGKMMDSSRIKTDYVKDQLPTLTFAHAQEICALLKNTGDDTCVWSSEDWKLITGANRTTTETPSWLGLPESRSLAIYISNLPGNSTRQKMEAMLEMEADCNLEEICMMKDPVTRGINGVGWGLMSDEGSVQRAVDFFIGGEARVFGQAITISKVKVKVDDDVDAQATTKAKKDLEERLKLHKKEDKEYRALIQRSAEESWKRHAYRLAHPAYADGRIW